MTPAEQFSNPAAVLAVLARAMANLVPVPSMKTSAEAEKDAHVGQEDVAAAASDNLAPDPKQKLTGS
jgi:hypothetical protein